MNQVDASKTFWARLLQAFWGHHTYILRSAQIICSIFPHQSEEPKQHLLSLKSLRESSLSQELRQKQIYQVTWVDFKAYLQCNVPSGGVSMGHQHLGELQLCPLLGSWLDQSPGFSWGWWQKKERVDVEPLHLPDTQPSNFRNLKNISGPEFGPDLGCRWSTRGWWSWSWVMAKPV